MFESTSLNSPDSIGSNFPDLFGVCVIEVCLPLRPRVKVVSSRSYFADVLASSYVV